MPNIQEDTKWVHRYILFVTEWSVSHETKKITRHKGCRWLAPRRGSKHIVAKDVVGLLLGEVVSTKKNTLLQRMWLAYK